MANKFTHHLIVTYLTILHFSITPNKSSLFPKECMKNTTHNTHQTLFQTYLSCSDSSLSMPHYFCRPRHAPQAT